MSILENNTFQRCPKCRGKKMLYVIPGSKSKGSLACVKCGLKVSGKTQEAIIQAWEGVRFWQNIEDCAERVKKWPKWKQVCIGTISELE